MGFGEDAAMRTMAVGSSRNGEEHRKCNGKCVVFGGKQNRDLREKVEVDINYKNSKRLDCVSLSLWWYVTTSPSHMDICNTTYDGHCCEQCALGCHIPWLFRKTILSGNGKIREKQNKKMTIEMLERARLRLLTDKCHDTKLCVFKFFFRSFQCIAWMYLI